MCISSINVNSFNVSQIDTQQSKTYLKIEGITGKRADIILMADCRLSNKGDTIGRLFNLTKNGRYKLYTNSTQESRGVAIAIKATIYHEVLEEFRDVEENYIILKIKIQGSEILLGAIYGPNNNDVGFFEALKRVVLTNGKPVILGGDFNTILDTRRGGENLDREGEGVVPNIQNSRFLNSVIEDGILFDPFRILYPNSRESSYISFRRGDVLGKNRLDFFLVCNKILGLVENVQYENRLGRDFDHKEVTLKMGLKSKIRKENITNDTVRQLEAKYVGTLAFYDIVNEHKEVPCEQIRREIGELEAVVGEMTKTRMGVGREDWTQEREDRLVL